MSLVTTHDCGFFSCCSVKLWDIVCFINTHKKLPTHVDSSRQFSWYKTVPNSDVTFDYFEDYNTFDTIEYNKHSWIDYHYEYQYLNYSVIDYKNLVPIVHKYFSPSIQVACMIKEIETKYSLDYSNLCVLFYRGNDKNRETKICGYDAYIQYANRIVKENPTIQFLLQSDETEFIQLFRKLYPNNSFFFKDEIRHMTRRDSTVDFLMRDKIDVFSKYYLAITMIMAKCKYIVCGTGNCSIWIMFYRGHNKNVFQSKDNLWIES
jgi:hypothetical protein